LQSLINSDPGLDELLSLKNDYEISKKIQFEGVLKSRELLKERNKVVVVKDCFNGITLEDFLKKNKDKRIVLMTTKAKTYYHKFKFRKNDILLFGRESAGVPENLHKTIKDRVKIPMNKKTRSLNVAMSVAIISAEALRQNNLLK